MVSNLAQCNIVRNVITYCISLHYFPIVIERKPASLLLCEIVYLWHETPFPKLISPYGFPGLSLPSIFGSTRARGGQTNVSRTTESTDLNTMDRVQRKMLKTRFTGTALRKSGKLFHSFNKSYKLQLICTS